MKRSLLLTALLLCGCASAPPTPMVEVEGRSCTTVPDFAAARQLQLAAGKAITVDLDQNAPCLQSDGGANSSYVIFALPDSLEPYLVTVRSPLIGQSLFAPRLMMLDGLGGKLREMPRDSFAFHGPSLYLGIRVYPGEKYLLVASDPAVVGRQDSQLREGVQVTTISTGTGAFNVYTGHETTEAFTYSLNGRVIVSAEPIPKVQ